MRQVVLALVASSSVTACLDPGSGETSSTSQHVVTKNRLATNRLATNRLATNQLLANPGTSTDILSTVDGRNVYSYVVSCALPSGTTIEADVPGANSTTDPDYCDDAGHCVFQGGVGVAAEWIDEP